jgi:aminoglycoside phosphotransferase
MAGPPPADGTVVKVPGRVEALAAGRPLRAVWENELGGTTFEIGSDPERRFVKWAPAGSSIDLAAEAERLAWAAPFTEVPRPLEQGSDEEGGWMVTAALPGQSAVADRWKADPTAAVAAVGVGLRALHDALPVRRCPFSWSLDRRLAAVERLAAEGRLDPAAWSSDHGDLSLAAALDLLADPPPIDELVVCHGDACVPNTLITPDGRCSGHVDLGALGVADRWADLAIATWSTVWNYGPGWEEVLLAAYGVAPDPRRTRYYRLLWSLCP